MARYRTPEEINHYDRFKLLTLLLLLGLLAVLLLFGDQLGLPADNVTGMPGSSGDAGEAIVEATPEAMATAVAETGTDVDAGDATSPAVLPGAAVPALLSPVPGTDIAAGEAPFSGTGEPGSTVRFYVDAQLSGETTVGDDGNWSVILPLVAGVSVITMETVGADGAVLNTAGPFTYNVSGATVPTINPPELGEDGSTAALAGTGEPGSQILILVNGQPGGTATVDDTGNWTLDIVVPPGDLDVRAQALDPSGVVIAQSRTVAIVIPGQGGAGITRPGTGAGGEFDPLSGAFTLSGTAAPGATVEILVNGEVAGTTTADDQGNWSFDVAPADGQNQVQIRVLDEAGNVTDASEPVEIEQPVTELPNLTLPGLVQPGDDGEPQLTLPGGSLAWTGTGEPGTQVEVVVDGQTAGIAPVDEQGNWTLDLALEPGQYTLQLFLLDANGSRVSGSTVTDFDVLAMVRPVVEPPQGGWVIGSNTITGTSEPGAELVVLVNGVTVASTTAGKDGLWAVTLNLPEGEASVQAVMVGDDGLPVFGSVSLEAGLVAPLPTLVEVAQSAGQFNTLLAAAGAAGLGDILSQDGPFTVFAPTDAAFAALPAGTIEAFLANPAALNRLLLHHVVPGTYPAVEAVTAGTLATAAGTQLDVGAQGGAMLVDTAAVITPDIAASNGVIHAIDSVLLPPLTAGVAGPVIDESGVPTFFGSELTAVGKAQPGTTILVQLNGENFGQLAGVDAAGNWLVSGPVTPGQYEIRAFMYEPATSVLLAVSSPVMLLAQ